MKAVRIVVVILVVIGGLLAALLAVSYLNTGHEVVISNHDEVAIRGGSIQFFGETPVQIPRLRPGESRPIEILPRGRSIYDGGYRVMVEWDGVPAAQESVSFLARRRTDKVDLRRGAFVRLGTQPDSGFDHGQSAVLPAE